MSTSMIRLPHLRAHSAPLRNAFIRSLSTSAPTSASSSSTGPILTESSINPRLVTAQYAVRGELVIRADSIRDNMAKGGKYPFNQIVACNIGNPQELKQSPITFFRQVLALCHYPALITDPNASKAFAPDAVERAKSYLTGIAGTGAYTTSQGIKMVRDQVASFISARDGYPADPDNIFITDGASAAVKMVLNAVIREGANDGVMVPIPQYPLYTASLSLFGGNAVKYYLDENKNWGLARAELERSLKESRAAGISTRALVVINPGNPTGQCLDVANMREIVDFCHKERIILMADEVYQTNIYSTTPFTSFKKVVSSMGDKYRNFELISFHSVSKGFLGECGQRGGYMELHNIDPAVRAQLYKLASISLCSNTSGQLMTGLMCAPPKQGDASYNTYVKERDTILESLKRRALRVAKALNELEGVTCQPVQGAMYAFPSISLPARAIAAAAAQKKSPDTFYALALLDATGVCVVPGSGFGQREGTYHFRTTILPSESTLDDVLDRMRVFHANFLKTYA